MHYYQFNIADYRKDTGHLSPMEHYVYRSLLDWMYLDELPIPKNMVQILRKLRLGNECSTDVEQVLNEFFTEREDGYIQGRALLEINEYNRRKESASVAGKASAAARKLNGSKAYKQTSNTRSTTVQRNSTDLVPTINHKPLTNIHSDAGASTRKNFTPPTVEAVSEYLADKSIAHFTGQHFVDFYQARGWKLSSGTKMSDWKAAVRTWDSRRKAESISTENTAFAGAL